MIRSTLIAIVTGGFLTEWRADYVKNPPVVMVICGGGEISATDEGTAGLLCTICPTELGGYDDGRREVRKSRVPPTATLLAPCGGQLRPGPPSGPFFAKRPATGPP